MIEKLDIPFNFDPPLASAVDDEYQQLSKRYTPQLAKAYQQAHKEKEDFIISLQNLKDEMIEVFGGGIRSTPLITIATAIGFGIVAITSPILSGVADYIGNKKIFMKFFNYIGALACVGLFWFSKT